MTFPKPSWPQGLWWSPEAPGGDWLCITFDGVLCGAMMCKMHPNAWRFMDSKWFFITIYVLHLHASCMCVFIFGPIELRSVKFTLWGACEFFWAPRCKCTVPDRDLNELEICQHNAFGGRDARKLRGTPNSASTATGFRLIFWLFVMVSFRGCWRSFLVIVAFLVSMLGGTAALEEAVQPAGGLTVMSSPFFSLCQE